MIRISSEECWQIRKQPVPDPAEQAHLGSMIGPYRLEHARYRLLFKHPFGTAHGLRDGTDAVFLRLSGPRGQGYGEATLPPYVFETADSVISELQHIDIESYAAYILNPYNNNDFRDPLAAAPAARAALSTAIWDLEARSKGCQLGALLIPPSDRIAIQRTAVTIGLEAENDIPLRIKSLPSSDLLKVKLGGPDDLRTLEVVQACDPRSLLIDANQGWTSIAQALEILAAVPPDRLAGIEQPFAKERWDLHAQLAALIEAPVFADESVQSLADLERASGVFGGVNIKLMKCGGLDVAMQMALRARELGLKVMYGSMSESSLGCGAMAQLQGLADVLDLDGPWLLRNDPFSGLEMGTGGLKVAGHHGIGVNSSTDLDWYSIGA